MLPFKSHMVDEILVEYKEQDGDVVDHDEPHWKITSYPHHDAMTLLKTGDDTKEVLFSDNDLKAFKILGYAVCHNKLDEHGKKVYLHQNMRTHYAKKKDK